MIKILLIIFLSFFLESNLSLFIPINTLFFNICFVFSSLIIISKMVENKNKYYLIVIIISLVYDLIFTNRLGFSVLTFLISSIFIKNIDKLIFSNSDIIKYLSIFVIYRLISYFILIIVGYLTFNYIVLLKSIYSSIILNLVYVLLFNYLFLQKCK